MWRTIDRNQYCVVVGIQLASHVVPHLCLEVHFERYVSVDRLIDSHRVVLIHQLTALTSICR